MKTVSPDVPRPRVLLFGIRCRFTEIIADRLAESNHPPIAMILPGPPAINTPIRSRARSNQLPMAGLLETTAQPDIETYQVGDLTSPATLDLIDYLEPDLIVVACFPRLIPRALLIRARMGAFNIHPSLLPAHRGPDPLFWIMRDGGIGCGVTIHNLASRFDSGDILAQRAVPYPDGARESELEARLAAVGVELTLTVIDAILSGTQARTRQDERSANYETWPSKSDYALDTNRPARLAWNFIRGVAERDIPIRVDTGSGHVRVTDAAQFGETGEPPSAGDGQVAIRFNPGWLVMHVDRENDR